MNTNLEFSNDRRLTNAEKQLLKQWIENGTPSGDLKSVTPPKFPGGWNLGRPDLVLKMSGRFEVPATGPDIYRSFVFPADLVEDKWVKAVELRPTARAAVHHALFFVDTTGEARKQDGRDGQPGLSGMSFLRVGSRRASAGSPSVRGLGGYVPGAMPNRLPGDLAMFLPEHYLRDALQAVVAGHEVKTPKTKPVGCIIHYSGNKLQTIQSVQESNRGKSS